MSIQDERELRARLSGALGSIEPRPAPVTRAVRQGRVIRMRRWVSMAAGLAVIVAGAALLPGFLQGHRVAPSAPLHYKVTVTTLGQTAIGGVIGQGTIGTHRWRVVVNRSLGDGCAPQPYMLTCGLAYGGRVGPQQVSLTAGSADGTQYEIGTVGAAVTRVAVRLGDGTVLTLRPVLAGGLRWIAMAAPRYTIIRATSFTGQSEYEYAIPYDNQGVADLVTWLRPGQVGLPVASKSVGSGRLHGVSWQAAVHTGPWGYCVSFENGSTCIPATGTPQLLSGGRIIASLACAPLYARGGSYVAWTGVMAVPPQVKDVVVEFATGSRLRMAAIAIAGTRVLGYAIPTSPSVTRTAEYGVSGKLLYSTPIATWGCSSNGLVLG